jgi:hypothetical protein
MALTIQGRWRTALIAAAALLCLAATTLAQRGFGRDQRSLRVLRNLPYDGQFTFVRVSYETASSGYWAGGRPSWAHGYPLAEQNLMKIMNEVSYLGAHTEEINTLRLEDPELFKYPVAYIIEVGWWTLTDRGADALRAYLQKGGFQVFGWMKTVGGLRKLRHRSAMTLLRSTSVPTIRTPGERPLASLMHATTDAAKPSSPVLHRTKPTTVAEYTTTTISFG